MAVRKNTDTMVDYMLLDYPNNMSAIHFADAAFVDVGTTYSASFTGDVTFSGSLSKSLARSVSFTASATFSGEVAKTTSKQLAAALSFSGALSRSTGKLLTAAVTFSGAVTKSVSRQLTSTLSFVGGLSKGGGKVLTGAVTFSGSVGRSVAKQLSASLTFAGATTKSAGRAFTASVSFTTAFVSQLEKWLELQLRAISSIVSPSHAPHSGVAMVAPHSPVTIVVRGPQEMAYKRGTNLLFEAVFTDKEGTLFDPDVGTIKIYVKKPDGTYYTGFDPATGGAAMVKVSTGTYQKDVQLARTDAVGRYIIESEGKTGSKTFLDELNVQVKA